MRKANNWVRHITDIAKNSKVSTLIIYYINIYRIDTEQEHVVDQKYIDLT